MTQLTKQHIQSIADAIAEQGVARPESTKSHAWVLEDGVYDHHEYNLRLFIWNGFAYYIATATWVDDPVANQRLPEWMRLPWGHYPSLPPKPPKK